MPPEPRLSIVFFGNDWSAENRTSSHHIARWLARRHQVLYVECPGLRAPTGSGRDLRKIGRKVWSGLRGARATPQGLHVATLLQLPFHGSGLVRWLNAWLTPALVRREFRRLGMKAPVLWFMVPHVGYLAGKLFASRVVYYCIDDYAALPMVDVVAVERMDRELTEQADLVFVAADVLLPAKRAINPATHLSPHGVDVDHFAAATWPETAVPEELDRLPQPRIGFFGLIEEWIDLDLVAWLAEQRPAWSFALIGRVAIRGGRVPQRSNLHYLGHRPYEQLPAYGKGFDAAIIPYRLTRQVMNANPIKLREYLAMGLPVVSVRTPEIEKFGDLVRIADDREAFLAALEETLNGEPVIARASRTVAAAAMSWDARLLQVESLVLSTLKTA